MTTIPIETHIAKKTIVGNTYRKNLGELITMSNDISNNQMFVSHKTFQMCARRMKEANTNVNLIIQQDLVTQSTAIELIDSLLIKTHGS